MENRERHQKMCDRAHEKTEQEFTLEIQARRYLSLFNSDRDEILVKLLGDNYYDNAKLFRYRCS